MPFGTYLKTIQALTRGSELCGKFKEGAKWILDLRDGLLGCRASCLYTPVPSLTTENEMPIKSYLCIRSD